MRGALRLLRWSEWGSTKIPMVCGASAYALGSARSWDSHQASSAALLVPILVALHATFGYAANSWSDVDADKAASKANPFIGLSPGSARSIVGFSALLVIAATIVFLGSMPLPLALSLLLMLGSAAYSLRPIRLKERGVAGLLASSLAQRSVPLLIAFAVAGAWSLGAMALLGAVTATGLRYIVSHQIADVANDRRSSTNTWVTGRGIGAARRFVAWVLAPAEVLLLVASLMLAPFSSPFYRAGVLIATLLLAWVVARRIPGVGRRKRVGVLIGAAYAFYLPLLFAGSLGVVRPGDAILVVMSTALWSFAGFGQHIGPLKELLLDRGRVAPSIAWTSARTDLARSAPHPVGGTTAAIERGCEALARMQQGDGSFPLFVKGSDAAPVPAHPLFSTAWLLVAVGERLDEQIVRRAAGYVASARSSDGTWGFDPTLGIPNDADSTAVALTALAVAERRQLDDREAALLRSFWREPLGPFKTWSGSAGPTERAGLSGDADDVVVCCNVLAALQRCGAPPNPTGIESIFRLLDSNTDLMRYYLTRESVAYSARRASLPLDRLPKLLTSAPGLDAPTLSLAQWVATFPREGGEIVPEILARQRIDGSWDAEGWISGIGMPQWGGAAVVTGSCIEALSNHSLQS